jgi:hypothetical protein
MKSFFQHREPPAALIASVDVGTSDDFTVLTVWKRIGGGYELLDYRQARPGQAVLFALPDGAQVLVEESDVWVVR